MFVRMLRVLSLTFVGLLMVSSAARANSFVFTSAWGKATITTTAGEIDIVLRNTFVNPADAGNLMTGFTFNFSPDVTLALASATGVHRTINIATNGYTDDATATDIQWAFDNTANFLNKGSGDNLNIVGPPDASDQYSAANASINSHNPSVAVLGVFRLTGAVTADTNITGVIFTFGTAFQTNQTGQSCPDCTPDTQDSPGGSSVPEPTSLLLLGTALAGGARALRNRRARQ